MSTHNPENTPADEDTVQVDDSAPPVSQEGLMEVAENGPDPRTGGKTGYTPA